jgi:hypothetical protein
VSSEALTASEIEGEILDRASVQSSIRRQLGLATDVVLIGVALIFLIVGCWRHGSKLAVILFICFQPLGIFELRRSDVSLAPPSLRLTSRGYATSGGE